MTTRHYPERGERTLEFSCAEIEDLLWRKCEEHGYQTRPEFFTYSGGRPARVFVTVRASEGPQEPSPRFAAFVKNSRILNEGFDWSDAEIERFCNYLGGLKPGRIVTADSLRMATGRNIYLGAALLNEMVAAGLLVFHSSVCEECLAEFDATGQSMGGMLECPNCAEDIKLSEAVLYEVTAE